MQVTAKQAEELFQFLRPEQVLALNAAAEQVSFKPGETIYRQGSKATYMYIVVSGKIALFAPGDDGVDVLINELCAGKLFGVCVCLGVDSYTATAQCSEDAWLLRINAEVLKGLMDRDPEIGYALERQIAKIYFGRYVNATQRLCEVVTQVGAIHDRHFHNHNT